MSMMEDINLRIAKLSFSGQRKVRVIRQIQRLIAAGIPLSRVFDTLYEMHSARGKKPNAAEAIAISEWRRKLRQGKGISECMGGWLSPAEKMILEAGERGGSLVSAFNEALETTEVFLKVRNTIVGGAIYPVVLISALMGMLWGFATQIVPTFATILPPEKWTGNPALVYSVSSFIESYLVFIVIALVAFGVVAGFSLPRLRGPARRYFDMVPPWSVYRVVQGVSFLMSLKSFIRGGIPITDAMRRMRSISTPYLAEIIDKTLDEMNMGHNLGVALGRTGRNFPQPDLINEVSIYADLDSFSDNLSVLALEWSSAASSRVASAMSVVNNIVLILIALCVAFIAASMFDLQDLITRSVRG